MKAEQSSKTFSRDEIRAAAREFQAPGVPAPAPDPSLEALRRGDEPSAELVAELAAMGCTVEDWRAAKAAGAL